MSNSVQHRYRHHFFLAVSVLLALATVALVGCGPRPANSLAHIGKRTVSSADFERRVVAEHGAPLLLQMIDAKLITAAADTQRLSVSDDEMTIELETGIAQVGSKTDLLERLDVVGLTLDDYREQIRVELLLDKLARQLIDTSEQALRTYYDHNKDQFQHGPQLHCRWMLFDDKASAEEVRGVLGEPGADFAGLAEAVSSDMVTAEKGGDMGFFEAEDYAPAVWQAAATLQINETSAVFKVPDGWAFIQLLQKRPAGTQPLAEVKDTLIARIHAEMLPQARQRWLNEARKQAHLRIPDKQLSARIDHLIAAQTPYQRLSLLNIPTSPSPPSLPRLDLPGSRYGADGFGSSGGT